MKTRMVLAILVSLCCSALAHAETTVYNANDEFSLAANPNGVWTYGHSDAAQVYAGNAAYLMSTATNWTSRGYDIDAWGWAESFDPAVTHNATGAPLTIFDVYTYETNDIGLDSYGPSGVGVIPAIIQWKAPRAGTVVADAMFRGSPVTIYECFNGPVVKSADNTAGTTWHDTFTVNAGDCIAFAAGGTATNSGYVTMFQGSVTYVPEPGTMALVLSGIVGLICYAWRKRK